MSLSSQLAESSFVKIHSASQTVSDPTNFVLLTVGIVEGRSFNDFVCLLWNRAFVKGVCSRPSCSTSSSRRLKMCPASDSRRTKTSWTFWCTYLRKKKGAEGREEATAGEPILAMPLWGMLYVDDAGVVSQPPEQLKNMLVVIVVVCAAFGLTVSETKTEIMCLRTKGMPESTATFSVETAGQVYDQTNDFVYLGGTANHNDDLSIEANRRIRNAW